MKKPLRIHAKSLSDALAPSKKIACGTGLRRLCKAFAFLARVPIVYQILARKAVCAHVCIHVCLVLLSWWAVRIYISICHQIAHGFTPPPVQNQYVK